MKRHGKESIFILLFLIIVIPTVAIGLIWHNEIVGVLSFKEIRTRDEKHKDGAVYEMTVGDYYLDDFVAQGGVSDDGELIDFVVKHITKGLIPVSIKAPHVGCSSFTACTENGDHIFARNYDMRKSNICIVHTPARNGRHATISTVDLSQLGMNASQDVEGLMKKITCLAAVYVPLDGMNDAGVSCAVYMSHQGPENREVATNQQTGRPDMTTTTFLRMVLDYADSLEDAVEIAKTYDMHDSAGKSYHYMVADSTGRSAIFEWIAGTDVTDRDGTQRELVITYNDDDMKIGEREGNSDFQWVTNFIIQSGYYEMQAAMHGLDRYDFLYEQLSPTNGTVKDSAEAMFLLQKVGRRTWDSNGGSGITVYSMVCNLTEKSIIWIPNEHYDDPSAWFTFKL